MEIFKEGLWWSVVIFVFVFLFPFIFVFFCPIYLDLNAYVFLNLVGCILNIVNPGFFNSSLNMRLLF